MPRKPRTIACIILNWNGARDTLDCLKSLRASILPSQTELKIIVVDNASSDNSLSVLKNIPDITLITNTRNLGYAGGNNTGLQTVDVTPADYYLVVNPDVMVDKKCIYEFVKFSENVTGSYILSPKIYFFPGSEYHATYKSVERGKVIWYAGGELDRVNILGKHQGVDEVDRGQFSETKRIEFATGACIFISRTALELLGGFDDRYFLYLEDLDFSIRASKSKIAIYYVPPAVAWHKNSKSSSVGGELHDYYITRNRMLFGLTHGNLKTKLALIKQSLSLLLSGRKWQRMGIVDFYIGRLGQGSYLA